MKLHITLALLIALLTNVTAGTVTVNFNESNVSERRAQVDAYLDELAYELNHPMNWCTATPTGELSTMEFGRNVKLSLNVKVSCDGSKARRRFVTLTNKYQGKVDPKSPNSGWDGPLYTEREYFASAARKRFPHLDFTWHSNHLMYDVKMKPEYDVERNELTAMFTKIRINDKVLTDVSRGDLVKIPLNTMLNQAYTIPEWLDLKGIYSKSVFTKTVKVTYVVSKSTIESLKDAGNVELSIQDCDRVWIPVRDNGFMNNESRVHPRVKVLRK
jgi:hypothetical protein